jgi:hypothetical protein
MNIVSIDPGFTGAMAYIINNEVGFLNLDKDPTVIVENFINLLNKGKIDICYIEKTGNYVPGNSGPAAVAFARHCGALDIIPYALGIPAIYVTPQRWMKTFNPPKDKKARKNYLWNQAKTRFPNTKIPKYSGDAFALLIYAMTLEGTRYEV